MTARVKHLSRTMHTAMTLKTILTASSPGPRFSVMVFSCDCGCQLEWLRRNYGITQTLQDMLQEQETMRLGWQKGSVRNRKGDA